MIGPATDLAGVREHMVLDEFAVDARRPGRHEPDEHEARAADHGRALVQQLAAVHCQIAQLLL